MHKIWMSDFGKTNFFLSLSAASNHAGKLLKSVILVGNANVIWCQKVCRTLNFKMMYLLCKFLQCLYVKILFISRIAGGDRQENFISLFLCCK